MSTNGKGTLYGTLGLADREQRLFEAGCRLLREGKPPLSVMDVLDEMNRELGTPVACLTDLVKRLPGLAGRDLLEERFAAEAERRAREQTPPPPQPDEQPPSKSAEPEPEPGDGRIATLAAIREQAGPERWLWQGWLTWGTVVGLASEEGAGKTRFVMDLIRRIVHREPWPDGQPMTAPADLLTLWVAADENHDELLEVAADFGIPDDRIYLNALWGDPRAGTSLETAKDFDWLASRVETLRARLLVVDTIGNATPRNLCRDEEAREFFKPLQQIANHNDALVLAVTHLNAAGVVLGRRPRGKVRTLIHLSEPDPDNQPNRRRLWVAKTFAVKPPPLGITMGDGGNDYNDQPPTKPGEGPAVPRKTGRPSAARDAAAVWLKAYLADGLPHRQAAVVKAGLEAGHGKSRLFDAACALGLLDAGERFKKTWQLPPDGEEESWSKTPFDD